MHIRVREAAYPSFSAHAGGVALGLCRATHDDASYVLENFPLGQRTQEPSSASAPGPAPAISLVSSFPAGQLLVVMFTQGESSAADVKNASWCAVKTCAEIDR